MDDNNDTCSHNKTREKVDSKAENSNKPEASTSNLSLRSDRSANTHHSHSTSEHEEKAPSPTSSVTSPQGSQVSLRSFASRTSNSSRNNYSKINSAESSPQKDTSERDSIALSHDMPEPSASVSNSMTSLRENAERSPSHAPLSEPKRTPSPQRESDRASPISVTFSDNGVDTSKSDHHKSLTRQIEKETHRLANLDFKSVDSVASLSSVASHINQHMLHNERILSDMTHGFETTRHSLDTLNHMIMDKIKDEKLDKFLHEPLNHLDEFEQAERKELRALAAEVREKIARAEKDLLEITKLCADLELMSIEAKQEAVESRGVAEEAARRAEAARKAAEEKARKEAEAKRKAEELAQRQAEEGRIRREQEEARKKHLENMKGTPEEQKRLDPNHWPIYIYRSEDTTDFDAGYNCVIRAMPGLLSQDYVISTRLHQLESDLVLAHNDELISQIVRVMPNGDDDALRMEEWEEPLSLLIPHCAPRSTSRELVVLWKPLDSTVWQSLEAREATITAVKHVNIAIGDAKLCECRPPGFGTFAVVYRLKSERLVFTKKGGKISSTVDSRVIIQSRPGAFRVNTNFTLQLQPVDLASVADVKSRYSDCSELISSSPIIRVDFPPRLHRSVAVSAPLPANQKNRPTTAAPERERKPASRPVSAFGLGSYAVDEVVEDRLHMLTQNEDLKWVVTELPEGDSLTQNKKGDMVTLETKTVPQSIWLLRTKADLPAARVEKIAAILFDYLHRRLVQFIMRQKGDDPTDVSLVCTNVNRVERAIRKLDDVGYTEGTQLSSEIFLSEGERVDIRLRGNLQPDEEVSMCFPFNTNMRTSLNLYVTEVDKYAQKGFGSYRGFVQFYAKERKTIAGLVVREIFDESDKKKEKKPIGTETVIGDVLLSELLIGLPKPEAEPPKPLKKAPINIQGQGPVDDSVLRHLASDLGDEWKLLATHLNIKKTRIQSIMRNHVNSDSEQAIMEMLLTWAKRIPRCMDKTDILCEALAAIGRRDLAEDIRDREMDYKHHRANQLKDVKLRQMFVKVAQHPVAMTKWKTIGEHLGVTSTELLNIENEQEGYRDRCIQALTLWKDKNEGIVSADRLARVLKSLRLLDLAGEVRSMNHY